MCVFLFFNCLFYFFVITNTNLLSEKKQDFQNLVLECEMMLHPISQPVCLSPVKSGTLESTLLQYN